ncbi:MAG: hypothetical protein ACK4K3_01835 [Aquabacterium sp.]|jgi:hypothetical protein
MLIEALKSPLTPQYWLLISKGYKTYLLMARNFPQLHPRRGHDNPDLKAMVSDYSEAMFPGQLNLQIMLLEFGDEANRLTPEAADITEAMRRAPDIRFFEECNPRGPTAPNCRASPALTSAPLLPPLDRSGAMRRVISSNAAPLGVDQPEDETVRPA